MECASYINLVYQRSIELNFLRAYKLAIYVIKLIPTNFTRRYQIKIKYTDYITHDPPTVNVILFLKL